MKKIRKGKKILLISIISILVIIASIFIIRGIVNLVKQGGEQEDPERVIALPETTYSEMKVTNIAVQYMKDNNQTKLMFDIINTTDHDVKSQAFDAILIGKKDEVIGQLLTQIQDLKVGETHALEVIYNGDLTQTKEIKLKERQ